MSIQRLRPRICTKVHFHVAVIAYHVIVGIFTFMSTDRKYATRRIFQQSFRIGASQVENNF